MLDKIYYIGRELPNVKTDQRTKFVLLGTPQEFIDDITNHLANKEEERMEELDKKLAKMEEEEKPVGQTTAHGMPKPIETIEEPEDMMRYVRKGKPKCSWCDKPATQQTVKGEDNLKSGGLAVNDSWYCDGCYKKGLDEEKEAMYG